MSRGAIVQDGNTEDSINKYLGSIVYESRDYKKVSWNNINDAPGGDILRLKSISTKDEVGKLRNQFKLNEKIIIETEFNVLKSGYQVSCVLLFSFYSSKNFLPNGNFYVIDNYVKNEWGKQKSFDIGNYLSRLEMPKNILNEGVYSITVDIFLPPALPDSSFQVRKHDAIFFDIVDNIENEGARGSYPGDWQAGNTGYMLRPIVKFETTKTNS